MSTIKVNTKFDGGSIEIVDINNPQRLLFTIRKDTNSEFRQWFYFQLNNIAGQDLTIVLNDLDKTAYPQGWEDYNICISYDNCKWIRLKSEFDGSNLTCKLKSPHNSVYLAYFEPYSYTRHLHLIGWANQNWLTTHHILGLTSQGRNIDLLQIGNESAKHKIWIIARQHPGETMAEWLMEGFIHKLLNAQDSISKTLLKDCVFYLVPNMNPDGAYLGNLRVNSKGINLNREWLSPSIDSSPEVYYVQQKMQQTGVHMFFDIHGDEAIPYVFTSGCEENPSYSAKQADLAQTFTHYFELINPDYQNVVGYTKGHFNQEASSLATSWVGNEFDCLAFTIELPFKDNHNLPDVVYGWNGKRSYLLGESLLAAINLVLRSSSPI
ncbi:MAG: hypothetical protein KBD37_06765 [Burkholderiales bacterium]|nr:hypothetical protein [Burkholderiales bacterium]